MGGRTLKRVPLDFKWPVGERWWGYMGYFFPAKCPACDGEGLNPATKQISDDYYDFDRKGTQWQHNITQDEADALWEVGRLTYDFKEKPTAAQVNEWSHHGMGHDCCNRWTLIKTRAKRLGVYGECEYCNGEEGIFGDAEHKRLYLEWCEKSVDPPEGPGFQVWETTSEGSPVSPVFATPEELADWCEGNVSIFGTSTFISKAEWLDFVKSYEETGDPSAIEIGSTLVVKPSTGFIGPIAIEPKE